MIWQNKASSVSEQLNDLAVLVSPDIESPDQILLGHKSQQAHYLQAPSSPHASYISSYSTSEASRPHIRFQSLPIHAFTLLTSDPETVSSRYYRNP